MSAVILGDPDGITLPFGKISSSHCSSFGSFPLTRVEAGKTMKRTALFLAVALSASAQESRITVPRIWDDKALQDWATPIAALVYRFIKL
jgi:hypothetical protein